MPAPRRELKTKGEVIDALGGYSVVAKTYGVAYQAPHNWVNYMPHIPSRLYHAMMMRLLAKGCTAPPSLWGMWPDHKRAGMN